MLHFHSVLYMFIVNRKVRFDIHWLILFYSFCVGALGLDILAKVTLWDVLHLRC